MSERDRQPGGPSYVLMPEDAPWEEGFGWTTVWGALFVGFVMLPGAIYLGLVTGRSLGGAAQWVSIILFIEIARRSFGKLKAQEIIILYWVAGGLITIGGKLGTAAVIYGGPFGGFIWDQYLINSQQAVGLAEHIPNWAMPPLGSSAYVERTFLHPDYLKPIVVLATVMILTRVNSLSLGYSLFRITNDIEKLPFPMAPVWAGGATALAESSAKQEGWRWRVFSTGTFIGVIWGAIYVVVPTLSGIFLTDVIQILPIPFADFTPAIRAILPATILGIATDLGALLVGFVLPFWVVVGTFIGSMGAFLVANPLLYKFGVLKSWSPGMKAIPTSISNTLDFWLSFNIGPAVLVALLGMGLAIRASLKRALATPREQREMDERKEELPEGRGDIPLWKALSLWAVSTGCAVALVHILVPDFPWWICALFGFVWTPFSSYIGARMIGLTGSPYGASFPYLREGSFYLSGYRGAAVWFAPIPVYSWGGMAQTFKQLELTKCRFSSLVYLNILTLVVMFVCSFIFWSLIWKLAPIPSAAYPYVQLMWPLHATFQALWATSTLPPNAPAALFGGLENPDLSAMEKGAMVGPMLGTFYTGGNLLREVINFRYIFLGLIVGTVVYSFIVLIGAPTLVFYGIVGGLYSWPMYTIPTFLGAMVGRFYMRKRFGAERWRAYAPILLAGYSCGMGLIGMTSIAIALIYKATSQITF